MSKFIDNKHLVFVFLFVLGVLSSFSLPPYNFFFINFLTFPLLFHILVKRINKNFINNFLNGWFYGFGYFLSNLYWISNSLKFDENFENLIIVSIILIPSLLSIFYGLFSLSLKFFNVGMNLSSILIFSLSLSIFEYLRGILFGGFPWNLISFSIIKMISSLQILSLIGTYSLNLLVITFFCLPVVILFKISKQKKIKILFSAILVLLFNSYYGYNKIQTAEKIEKKSISPSIKLVSPKFNIERFFIEEPIEKKMNELIEMSFPLSRDLLLIYPEGITNIGELSNLTNDFSVNSKKLTNNTKIILGISFDDGEKIFNSLALFNNEFKIEKTIKFLAKINK